MKSRIRNAIPKKIIGINISSQKRDIIEDIAKSENAEAKSNGHGTQSKLERWRAY